MSSGESHDDDVNEHLFLCKLVSRRGHLEVCLRRSMVKHGGKAVL